MDHDKQMQHQLHIVADASVASGGEGLAAYDMQKTLLMQVVVTLISLKGMDAPLR